MIPKLPWYSKQKQQLIVRLVTLALMLLAILSVIFTLFMPRSIVTYCLVGFWAIGPPLWFVIEAEMIFDQWDNEEARERFKYGQALASRVWAGIGALLILILSLARKGP